MNSDLTKVLSKKYVDQWVALDSKQTRVVASGKSVKEVADKAKKSGVKDPVVTFVIDDYRFLIS